jgi:hypothetical protein
LRLFYNYDSTNITIIYVKLEKAVAGWKGEFVWMR